MTSSLESAQKKLSQQLTKMQTIQKTYQKTVQLRQQLDSQLTENNIVKEEMDLLEDGAKTYKLVGPALLRVDLKDARDNVNSRIKYIMDEIKRHDVTIQDLEKQLEDEKEVIGKCQLEMQKMQAQANAAAGLS